MPKTAQLKSDERCQQKRFSKLEKDGILRDYVVRSLQKGWSPEQIAGRMKYQKLTFYACPETIYQFVYRSNDKALYYCLPYKNLRDKNVILGKKVGKLFINGGKRLSECGGLRKIMALQKAFIER